MQKYEIIEVCLKNKRLSHEFVVMQTTQKEIFLMPMSQSYQEMIIVSPHNLLLNKKKNIYLLDNDEPEVRNFFKSLN